ncbi:MAG TPA: hypothetical protein VNP92_11810 [Actinophytocola sp.]|nr:hypothetical protein [Actinophytocola sp.]
MGWEDFYRRRDALDAVLDRGELTAPPPFTDTDEVLLALHHRWSLRLAGRVELAELAAADDPALDLVDAVRAAWRETAAAEEALRNLLDTHADRPALRAVVKAEQRMLAAAAGLAAPADSPAERAAVGAALVALTRTELPGPRRGPVARLLHRLAPSA